MTRRQKQRENRKKGREARLETKNAFGDPDPTPWQAVDSMRGK